MAVRVKIKIETGNKTIQTVALANSGYETTSPEIILPVAVASKLGIYPELPQNTKVETYATAGGPVKMYKVSLESKIKLIAGKKSLEAKLSNIVIDEYENEVLLGDTVMSQLGIVIEDAKKGLWRCKKIFPTKIRKSYKSQIW